jgi:hypothetical protein
MRNSLAVTILIALATAVSASDPSRIKSQRMVAGPVKAVLPPVWAPVFANLVKSPSLGSQILQVALCPNRFLANLIIDHLPWGNWRPVPRTSFPDNCMPLPAPGP